MNVDVIAVAVIGIAASMICVMLKPVKPELALATGVSTSIVLLIYLLTRFSPVTSLISSLMLKTGVPSEYIRSIFRVLGICLITSFGADSCNDVGQTALAAKIELAGKIAVIVICIPMLTKIIEIIQDIVF